MGALTSKPYAFSARSWELSEKENCDFNDFYSSPIKLDFRGFQLMRVRPNLLTAGSDEWIADRIRFSYDSYNSSAANYQVKLSSETCFFRPFSVWFEDFFLSRFFSVQASFVHDLCDYSFLRQFAWYSSSFGRNYFSFVFDNRNSFFSAPGHFFADLYEKNVFFVGFNIRYNHPIYSIKMRQVIADSSKKLKIFSFGPYISNCIDEVNLGASLASFLSLVRSKSRASKFAVENSIFFCPPSRFSSLLSRFVSAVAPSTSYQFDACEISLSLRAPKVDKYAVFSSSFSSYTLGDTDAFAFPVPHPFARDRFVFSPFLLCYRFIRSSFTTSPSYFSYKFTPILQIFENYSEYSQFSGVEPTVRNGFYEYSSFYTHYTANEYLQHSKNILLNFKRNQDVRYNYIYFL